MKLSGNLQGEQVKRLWEIRQQWWQDESMDLCEVLTLDSAGIALMVKWGKAVRERGAIPLLTSVPDDFTKLATLYGVADLFSIESQG
ncbi:STAS domain-containing protein [Aeromonas simiae]|uniref:STAS domain-containing protein n=1 Tax=Aeromonas simiae TaxID=218936 RepID=A0A5J6WZT6_9GAMM|nr:STAS domain-containing protein [Aeromonas simiae]MDO2948200.1 STAS domain-containing protein [Aeromonas simiae]MDO2951681.1 STAS domain-containing protein [Aeromonas simiae]MDO2955611.1 STAS domain-containing protein [Aeromonas simiae]QFI55781.1 STAS domain-containing protein [Aeromonas simiae]